MKKQYVLDTNVLLLDEDAMHKFEENDVYIPVAVLDELNILKEDYRNPERAEAARAANKEIRKLLGEQKSIKRDEKRLKDEIVCTSEGGGNIFFTNYFNRSDLEASMSKDISDWEIILTAKALRDYSDNQTSKEKKRKVILVTNDNGMANRAMGRYGLTVEEYKNPMEEEVYSGRTSIIEAKVSAVKMLQKGGSVSIKDAILAKELENGNELHENQFVELYAKEKTGGIQTVGKVVGDQIVPLYTDRSKFSGIKPQNNAQYFAKECVVSPVDKVPLAIISGPAGTGKTLLAVAGGLDALDRGEVKQVLLLRPNVMIDKNDAALPGNEQEKIDPLMRPYWDNLKTIMLAKGVKPDKVKSQINQLIGDEKIRVESFSYIRGRSISDTYIICDESQNLLRKHVIGILTRPGEHSKLVLLGDPTDEQIDNPYVNKYNNGLVFAMNLMKDSPLCYQTTFYENESKRGSLVKDVISRLKENKK